MHCGDSFSFETDGSETAGEIWSEQSQWLTDETSIIRGDARWWSGVDMSTPLLPDVLHHIDANPASLYGRWNEARLELCKVRKIR